MNQTTFSFYQSISLALGLNCAKYEQNIPNIEYNITEVINLIYFKAISYKVFMLWTFKVTCKPFCSLTQIFKYIFNFIVKRII